jgi:glycerate 2-kinase
VIIMRRVVVAPDSFKGSLAALEVAGHIAAGIGRVLPECRVDRFAMADGGEGSIDAVLATRQGQRHVEAVANAVGVPTPAQFATLDDGGRSTALLEVAQVVALPGAPAGVEDRSSYGVGQQLRRALDLGVRSVLVGLGGSSTNEAGAGLLAALGVRFTRVDGRSVERPALRDLEHIAAVDFAGLDPRLSRTRLQALSDIDSPLCGEGGATAVFGLQKGVVAERVAIYDRWIARFAALCESAVGRQAATSPGAGAAGGIGWALQLIGAEAKSGAIAIAEMNGLDAALEGADWALTGEGRSDAQTLRGKVPLVVSQLARRRGTTVTLLCGAIAEGCTRLLAPHFDGCFSIIPRPMALGVAMERTGELLADAAEQLTRLRFAARR